MLVSNGDFDVILSDLAMTLALDGVQRLIDPADDEGRTRDRRKKFTTPPAPLPARYCLIPFVLTHIRFCLVHGGLCV